LLEIWIEKDISNLGGQNRYPKLNPKLETSEKLSHVSKPFILFFLIQLISSVA